MISDVGCVIIGRNEGDRLRRCLMSLVDQVAAVVYVDSGSTDGFSGFGPWFRGNRSRVGHGDPLYSGTRAERGIPRPARQVAVASLYPVCGWRLRGASRMAGCGSGNSWSLTLR